MQAKNQLELCARNLDLEDHLIVQDSEVIKVVRSITSAFHSHIQVQVVDIVNKIHPKHKLLDLDQFPLSHGLGLMHLISETDFDIASAMVIDISYLGLLPIAL